MPLLNRVINSCDKAIKIGVIGLSGSGRATYLALLIGMLMAPGKIFELTRDIADNPKLIYLIRNLSLVNVATTAGKISLRAFSQIISQLMGEDRFFRKTRPLNGYLIRVRMNIPLYDSKSLVRTDLFFPDLSGEDRPILEDILEIIKLDEVKTPMELKNTVLEKLTNLERAGNRLAYRVKAFIETTDYDGFLILIDPDEKKIFTSQYLLYVLLMLLLPNQENRNLVTTFIFTKAVCRGLIKLSEIRSIGGSFDTLKERLFIDATDRFMKAYGLISALLKRYSCGKRPQINFGGTFYYDAFCTNHEGPELKTRESVNKNKPLVTSLNAILPVLHTVHLILGKKFPTKEELKIIKRRLCL